MMILWIVILVISSLLSVFFALYTHAYMNLNRSKLRQLTEDEEETFINKIDKSDFFDIKVRINRLLTYLIMTVSVIMIGEVQAFTDIKLLMLTLIVLLSILFEDVLLNALARLSPEKIVFELYNTHNIISYVYIPVSALILGWYKLLKKIFKVPNDDVTTEDELLDIVDEAQTSGSINEDEGDLIRSVLDFGDLKVVDIFTPRVQMIGVSINETGQNIVKKFKKSGYSRLPVYQGGLDDIVGTINHKDFYNKVVLEKNDLSSIIKKPVNVSEYMKVSDLLSLLQENKSHMAIVKDEFNGTLGIVTMEDILEELVGEIWDEHDEIVERISKVSDHEFKVKGDAELEDLFDSLNLDLDDSIDHTTVNGWVLEQLGSMAQVGMSFTYEKYHILVTAADDKKVLEVLITTIEDYIES